MPILVIGSTNTDMVVTTGRFPRPGETLLGNEFFLFPGGKGANQAVAAARLGAKVTFITCLGDDLFGRQALDGLASEGIRTEHSLIRTGVASGVAVITVNKEGENTIVVVPGANEKLTMDHLGPLETVVYSSDLILMQLEIPMETVEGSIRMAASLGKRVILNPAPARPLPAGILKGLFAITPNETEAEALTGIKVKNPVNAAKAGSALLAMGVINVIITMGSSGAFFMDRHTQFMVPADQVEAVDTTAAGDVFNGALAVAISEGLDWHDAVAFANRAAGIAVTRMGAQTSAPFRKEIKG